MLIGTGRIVLDYFGNQNVNKKRRELESLCEELRRKFNLSALEVASFDDPERCVLGFAAVIPENWKTPSAESFVRKICDEIDSTAFARVVVEDWDLISHGTFGEESDSPSSEDRSPEAREIARRRAKARRTNDPDSGD